MRNDLDLVLVAREIRKIGSELRVIIINVFVVCGQERFPLIFQP
jgi:hypothetical protein